MKFTCTQSNLSTLLGHLEWVVGRQAHLPILSNILFEAIEGKVRLFATNLEIGAIALLGARVEKEGKVVLPAKLLTQFVMNLDSQEVVTFEQKGNQVLIQNGKDEIRINSVESKDFPLIPEHTGEYEAVFSAKTFFQALKNVGFAASHNESRAELTGVFLSTSPRGIHMTATDSFRLAEVTLGELASKQLSSLQTLVNQQGGVILPLDTLQELARIAEGDEEIAMTLKENQAFFEIGGVKVVSRVIQGRYPDYQQILPKEFQLEIVVPKQALLRALKMATGFAQYGAGEVQFSFLAEKGVLELTTLSSGVGEQRTTITLHETLQEDRIFLFQPRHILEGVNTLEGELVQFHLNSKDMPVLITGESQNQLYLVMPIRK